MSARKSRVHIVCPELRRSCDPPKASRSQRDSLTWHGSGPDRETDGDVHWVREEDRDPLAWQPDVYNWRGFYLKLNCLAFWSATESIVLETCAYERCVLVMVVRDRLTLTALLSCDLMVVVSDNYRGVRQGPIGCILSGTSI